MVFLNSTVVPFIMVGVVEYSGKVFELRIFEKFYMPYSTKLYVKPLQDSFNLYETHNFQNKAIERQMT